MRPLQVSGNQSPRQETGRFVPCVPGVPGAFCVQEPTPSAARDAPSSAKATASPAPEGGLFIQSSQVDPSSRFLKDSSWGPTKNGPTPRIPGVVQLQEFQKWSNAKNSRNGSNSKNSDKGSAPATNCPLQHVLKGSTPAILEMVGSRNCLSVFLGASKRGLIYFTRKQRAKEQTRGFHVPARHGFQFSLGSLSN